jgi:methylated-DNA-[protein]-cysteine S-methyltransferase
VRSVPVVATTAYDAGVWGIGLVHRLDGQLVEHEMPEPGRRESAPAAPEDDPVVSLLVRYFRGEPVSFATVDIEPALTAMGASSFEGAVLRELHAVPYGTTVGYGELARRAGHPRAGRAAGTVCARGLLDVILPYHRVIAADGSIGRYGPSGVRRKQHLLAHEGVTVLPKVVRLEGARA